MEYWKTELIPTGGIFGAITHHTEKSPFVLHSWSPKLSIIRLINKEYRLGWLYSMEAT